MINGINLKSKEYTAFWVFLLFFLSLGFCFSSPVMAGYPIGGKEGIVVYLVTESSFSVVWQVDVPSTCTVRVFKENNNTNPVSVKIFSTHSSVGAPEQLKIQQEAAQELGVMQVVVQEGIEPGTQYYIQTVSFYNSEEYVYPPFGDLIPVKTELSTTGSAPDNGFLYFRFYNQNGVEELGNWIKGGIVAVFYAESGAEKANYPICNLERGFPGEQEGQVGDYTIILGDFKIGSGENNYWTWSNTKDYEITLTIFGGSVPEKGYGKRVFKFTFQGGWIPGIAPCLPAIDGCDDSGGIAINKLRILHNQAPNVILPPRDTYDPYNPAIPAYIFSPGVQRSLTVCVDDPDQADNPVTNIYLDGNVPDTMVLNAHTDSNCRFITWSPLQTDGGFHTNIKVAASDGTTQGAAVFTAIVENGPPTTPQAEITTLQPLTMDDINCFVNPNSVINPDSGESSYLDFIWYKKPNTVLFSDLNKLLNPGTPSTYNSNLDYSKTLKGDEIYCEVTAHDDDGYSAIRITNSVVIGNTPPPEPASVTVTPETADLPDTTEILTCTANMGGSDVDINDTITYYFLWTSGTKQYESGKYESGNVHELPAAETGKDDTWTCTVTTFDGTDESATATPSNSVTIVNTAPKKPEKAEITPSDPISSDPLTCTVTPASPPDIDPEDVGTIQYEYTWSCTNCSESDIVTPAKASEEDTLDPAITSKWEVWSCSVRAKDSSGVYSSSVNASSVTILNSPPEGLGVELKEEGAAAPDPNGYAYITGNLECTVKDEPIDPDEEVITYTYSWTEQESGSLAQEIETQDLFDILDKGFLKRGQRWTCEVSASDGNDAVSVESNELLVFNRPPSLDTNPAGPSLNVNEGEEVLIEVIGSDPDEDDLEYMIDSSFTDPNDPGIGDWLELDFDTNTLTLRVFPLSGSSGVDVEYGAGVFKFNFIVNDVMRDGEDQIYAKSAEKLITINVNVPCAALDDFEYPSSKPGLSSNGWYKLQGCGSMALKPGTGANHYLQTTVCTTPTNNSQLAYIITKEIGQGIYTSPEIRAIIKDNNLYYFETYVRAYKGASEANFFIRFAPVSPKQVKVSGNYVINNIGAEFINSEGKEIAGNMEELLFKNTGWHFKYLKGLLIRGDIMSLDNIQLCQGVVDRIPPKEVVNLNLNPGNAKVTLTWQIDSNQHEDIAGYKIYMSATQIPAPTEANLQGTVGPNVTSHPIEGLTNGTTYYFRVNAFDSALQPNQSQGKTISGTPQLVIPQPPQDLTATPDNGGIILTWENPSNQSADYTGYEVYYCSCTTECSSCYSASVSKSLIKPDGSFQYTITKDAQGNLLTYGKYYFTVKAKDNANNYSTGVTVSATVVLPSFTLIDDLEYVSGQTLATNCWYKLQGCGNFGMKTEGTNHYLELKSCAAGPDGLYFAVAKCIKNPELYTSPEFGISIRSLGYYRIDLYVLGTDNNKYFLSYKGDPSVSSNSGPTSPATRWYVYTLGWLENKNIWKSIQKNLSDDLKTATGVGFSKLLGIVLRGTLDIDNIKLFQTFGEVQALNARAGNSDVLLSMTIVQPELIENINIYVNGTPIVLTINDLTNISGNDYSYLITGLTNGEEYNFKVTQVVGGQESSGILVKATPRVFLMNETFDTLTGWNVGWGAGATPAPDYGIIYNSDMQSDVMYLETGHQYPDRFYLSKSLNLLSAKNMALRIKSEQNTNFVIWVELIDTTEAPLWIGFVPGGTRDAKVWHGWFAYYYLGPGYNDGSWHTIEKDINSILISLVGSGNGIEIKSMEGISVGGNIKIDDLVIY